MVMLTALHEQRLQAVCSALKSSHARQVLDLGCGSGALTCLLLSDPDFDSVLAMDRSSEALATLRQNLANGGELGERLTLVHGSWTDTHPGCQAYQAAALVETIEHLDPRDLSRMENTVFAAYDLDCIVVTTPNGDYNPLLGLGPGQFRDPDHRFEWPRVKFRKWCRGLASRHGYQVRFADIGDPDPELGAATQMAVFTRTTSSS
ncbi:MAG: methyltransferase domain-containing protein [Wenzhouxiangella sp.]|nr:MAG: methyltransferase domain-containing protein [Wenzhouxiangella sp.]